MVVFSLLIFLVSRVLFLFSSELGLWEIDLFWLFSRCPFYWEFLFAADAFFDPLFWEFHCPQWWLFHASVTCVF